MLARRRQEFGAGAAVAGRVARLVAFVIALAVARVARSVAFVVALAAAGAVRSITFVIALIGARAASSVACVIEPAGAARSIVLVAALAAAGPVVAAPGDVREIEWEDLMPEGWDPLAGLDALMGDDAQALSDDSARAIELFDAYQEAVRSAPVVGELDGERIRLPGFMVPLDFEGTETSEFLLVPYFGACIHVPPPPSNQIVYVKTVAGYPMKELFDPVWVTGVISTQAHLNEVGDAGYTLQATIIEPYSY